MKFLEHLFANEIKDILLAYVKIPSTIDTDKEKDSGRLFEVARIDDFYNRREYVYSPYALKEKLHGINILLINVKDNLRKQRLPMKRDYG